MDKLSTIWGIYAVVLMAPGHANQKLDFGWPESEKDVFQAALRMVVVKDSR